MSSLDDIQFNRLNWFTRLNLTVPNDESASDHSMTKWLKLGGAFFVSLMFIANGWYSFRHPEEFGEPLWRWLGKDPKSKQPLVVMNGVLSILAGVAILVAIVCALAYPTWVRVSD